MDTEPGAPATPEEHRPAFSRVVRVARTGSTNADLAAALRGSAGAEWPHLSVLVADHQTAGRGRAGRSWETPPGTALTASVVLRPSAPRSRWSWLSLLGGLAVARAVVEATGLRVGLKWPNDVLVLGAGAVEVPGWGRDRKVAGILTEVVDLPGGDPAAILGFGVNLSQRADELPVAWATSLAEAGAGESARDAAALLTAVGRHLAGLLAVWEGAAGDALDSGLDAAVAASCETLGRPVRIALPGGEVVEGRALRLDGDGALVVRRPSGEEVAVAAGDVDHIRTPSG